MGISALARARALGWDRAGGSRVADASQGDAAKVDAARRHLTELKKEIRAEAAMLASLAGPPSAEE